MPVAIFAALYKRSTQTLKKKKTYFQNFLNVIKTQFYYSCDLKKKKAE